MSDHKSRNETTGLLGDLESIRVLLDDVQETAQGAGSAQAPRDALAAGAPDAPFADPDEALDENSIPLLSDVVSGGMTVDEETPAYETAATAALETLDEDGDASAGLDDRIFQVLLGDQWRESATAILDEARTLIEARREEWTPADTDELNQALKTRIDETLQAWLRETVLKEIDSLRHRLLDTVSRETTRLIRARLDSPSSDESSHGS